MTHIIPFSLKDRIVPNRLCNAAWQFACAVLWSEESFNEEEQQRSLQLIKEHIDYPRVSEKTFTEFCERILLAHESLYFERSTYLPQPFVWLHPKHTEGYSTTRRPHQQLLQKRMEVPGYRREYAVLVAGFYRYSYGNRRSTVNTCRRSLIKLKAFDLLILLYRTIIYCKYLHQ